MRKVVRYGGILACGWTAANLYQRAQRDIRGRHDRDVSDERRHDGPGDHSDESIHRGKRGGDHQRPGGGHRQGERSHWLTTFAVVTWLFRLVLGAWWDPTSWWQQFWNGITDVPSDAITAITNAINYAISQVETVYDSEFSALEETVDYVQSSWNTLSYFITTYGVELADWLDVTGGDVATWVQDVVYATAQDAINTVADGLGFAYDALQSLVDGALSSIDELFTLYDAVDSYIIGIIQDELVPFGEYVWNTYLEPIIGPIQEAVDWIETALEQLGDDAWDTITNVIDLVTRAEEWLVWMAEHSFDDLTQLWGSVPNQATLGWIEQQAADPEGYVDQWAEDLANMVSGGVL